MSSVKDQYIREYERIENEALDRGLTREQAERLAEFHAYDAMRDRLADMADRAKKIKRGE